jgi:FkbM family methyltransferase
MELNTHSQIGQDIAVANFFQLRRGGYFIEVGAYNGVDLSNTYLLEKQLDWKGICIEPLPAMFTLLQQNRSCICVKTAAYSKSGLEFEFIDSEMLSGIVQNIDKHTYVLKDNKIKVQTKTLTEIMDEHHAPLFIEYLSIDTEGSELEVLRGIDWDRYSFGYINIEHNYVEPRRTEMRRFLEERGYTYLRENHFDDDYIGRTMINKTYAKSCF